MKVLARRIAFAAASDTLVRAHTHTLAYSSTRWFSTLASLWLCLRKPRNVSSGFLISDHSIEPCEAYSTVFSRQSSLEIDIHCLLSWSNFAATRVPLSRALDFGRLWTAANYQTNLVSARSTAQLKAFPLFALVCLLFICISCFSEVACQLVRLLLPSPAYDASIGVQLSHLLASSAVSDWQPLGETSSRLTLQV